MNIFRFKDLRSKNIFKVLIKFIDFSYLEFLNKFKSGKKSNNINETLKLS